MTFNVCLICPQKVTEEFRDIMKTLTKAKIKCLLNISRGQRSQISSHGGPNSGRRDLEGRTGFRVDCWSDWPASGVLLGLDVP